MPDAMFELTASMDSQSQRFAMEEPDVVDRRKIRVASEEVQFAHLTIES